MNRRLLIIFLLIVTGPSALLLFFGLQNAGDEEGRINSRFYQLVNERLSDVNSSINRFIDERQRAFKKTVSSTDYSPARLRSVAASNRLINQVFVIDKNNTMLYPLKSSTASASEKRFFNKTAPLWSSLAAFAVDASEEDNPAGRPHWHTWFYGDGLQMIFWNRNPDGNLAGLDISRIAFMADLVAVLPETKMTRESLSGGRITLSDAADRVVYQWGHYRPTADEEPFSRLSLAPPLNSWTLKYYLDRDTVTGGGFLTAYVYLVMGIMFIIITVLLAWYFYRENNRQLQEALNQVSFVNRVSHELKTPLTNIRMYAEFLENYIEPEQKKPAHYVKVVINECERLSRLIGNVLTFAKQQNHTLQLNFQAHSPDTIIRKVLDSFSPSLKSHSIRVKRDLKARRKIEIDADVLTQVLSNLISNVEKYAAGGKYLHVASRIEDDCLLLEVADHGPGIDRARRSDIFKPFYRISNRLNDGVSGTGIGLTIVKDLAEAHGGRVKVNSREDGSLFEVCLPAGGGTFERQADTSVAGDLQSHTGKATDKVAGNIAGKVGAIASKLAEKVRYYTGKKP